MELQYFRISLHLSLDENSCVNLLISVFCFKNASCVQVVIFRAITFCIFFVLRPEVFCLSVIPRISNWSGHHLSRKVIGTPITPLHLVLNEDSCICLPSINCKSMAESWVIFDVSIKSDDFKLVWTVFIEECNWDSHDAVMRTFCLFVCL